MLAHVDMDAFYAAVEVLDNPALAGRPVIVGGGRRGVVSAASYEARRFGVRSALPMYLARRLCPQGEFLPVRMGRYQEVSRLVMETLERFSPLVEPVSVDEAYLDLSGTQGLWGPPRQAGQAIKQAVRQATGLTCSVGLAPLRFLAKIASDRDKPDGLTVVEDLEGFLATVSLQEVPGVGKKTLALLKEMGLTRLVELRPLGADWLERRLGSWGLGLWELAQGRDPRPVASQREIKSVSNEHTLEQDTADRDLLAAHLLALSQKVGARLQRKNLCGKVVALKLKHADFRLVTRRVSLPQPAADTSQIYQAALALLRGYASPGPWRLIGVGVSELCPADKVETGLFDAARQARARALGLAEQAVREKFGDKALTRAGTLPLLGKGGSKGDNGRQTS